MIDLSTVDDAALRALLPAFLASYIEEPAAAEANRARVGALVAGWSAAELAMVREGLPALGEAFRVYPALPPARALSRVWCRDVLTEARLEGAEHLRAAREAGPVVIVGNHLTYFDTNAADAALAWGGHADLADRIATVAGPKVYETLFRRFAAACLSTLPVPQSTSLDGAAELPARELARRAIASLQAARGWVEQGGILQIYPEGTRTRSGRLQPFLRAVYRYLDLPGARVVPAALSGTDGIMPVSAERLSPGPVVLSLGAPIPVDGDPKAALAAAWHAVAALLPEPLRPEEGTEPLR